MNRLFLLLVAVFFLAGLCFIYYIDQQSRKPENSVVKRKVITVIPTITPQLTPTIIQPITITDEGITPATFKVPYNAIVGLRATNKGSYHNLAIDELQFHSPYLTTDKSQLFVFVATQSGTFNIYSDTGHLNPALRVVGKITIE